MRLVNQTASPFMTRLPLSLPFTFAFPPSLRRHNCHMSNTSTPASNPNSSTTTSKPPKPKVLVLTGPTSVGKSSTAISYCLKHGPAEIISADSVQLYRHLSIGCNKPTEEELNAVTHHLLNVANPDDEETYSAGDFYHAARRTTKDIINRDKFPVIVGGTMMYVRWYIHGRPATPPTADDARERTKHLIDQCQGNWEQAIQLLKVRDEKRSLQITKNDWYRLTRAIEVWETTGGKGVTDLPIVGGAPGAVEKKLQKEQREHGQIEETIPDQNYDEFDFRCIFLYMPDRVAMNRRIDLRCEQMIIPKKDLLYLSSILNSNETNQDLLHNNDWQNIDSVLTEITNLLVSSQLLVTPTSPCLAIGYRQTIHYLISLSLSLLDEEILPDTDESNSAPNNESERKSHVQRFREYIEEFQQATRNYAKQQIAWFRKDPLFQWVPVGTEAVAAIAHLTELPKVDYQGWCEENANDQTKIKLNMMEQGKKAMRTYIARRTWVAEGSDVEKMAVQLATSCARLMAQRIPRDELEQMLKVVTRQSSSA